MGRGVFSHYKPRPSSRISCRSWHRFTFAKVAAVSQGLSLHRSGWIDIILSLWRVLYLPSPALSSLRDAFVAGQR